MKSTLFNLLAGCCGGVIITGKAIEATGETVTKVGKTVTTTGVAWQLGCREKAAAVKQDEDPDAKFAAKVNAIIDDRLRAETVPA